MTVKFKFNPKKDHVAVKEYGILGETLDKPIAKTKAGWLKVATIPIKNLAIGLYQRDIDHPRVNRIKNAWHNDLGYINVAEIKHKGKYYYQIVDGQHRASAFSQIGNEICCIVTNSFAPVDNFLMANNSRNVKSLDVDGEFWAKMNRLDSVIDARSKNDEDNVKFVYDLIERKGYKPQKKKNKSDINFGNHVAALHKIFEKYVQHEGGNIVQDIALENNEDLNVLSRRIFKDAADVLFCVFGANAFTYSKPQKRAWEGMLRFLRKIEYKYNKQRLKEAFKKGKYYMPTGRIPRETGKGIDSWRLTALNKFGSSKRVIYEREKWTNLFTAVHDFTG